MTNTETTLLVAVISGTIGIIGTYVGAIGIANRQALKEAANIFMDIFETIHATIRQNPDLSGKDIVATILEKNYVAQVTAMKSLSRRLCCSKRKVLKKAWQEYEDPDNCGGEPFLSYSGVPFEIGKKPFDREYIIHAIEHLISFANR